MSLNKKKEITDRIWAHSKTSGANKLMLLALTELADDDGFCWPSYETLGNMVGLTGTPDSIKRCALNNLAPLIEKNEVIVWKQQGKKGGRGFTNIYLIAVGLTDEQIKEIVKRRFELQDSEADSVLAKEGEEYTRLCTDRRVSSEALERTRDTKKGDTSIRHSQPMGDKSITDNSIKGDTSIQDDPAKSQKGDRLDTRTESPKNESNLDKESLKVLSPPQKLFLALADLCHIELRAASEKQKGQLGKASKALVNLVTDLDQFKAKFPVYWAAMDWRGQKGQSPDPPQIQESYGDYCHWIQNGAPTQARKGQPTNGTHQSNSRKGIKALEETGESLRGKPTIDIYTNEYVYPDKHREPIPPVSRVPRRGLLSS